MTTKLGCKFIAATNTQRFEADPMATHGHLWPPLYSQVAHCYALVKTSYAGDRPRPASGPWPFKPELNQLKTGRPYWGSGELNIDALDRSLPSKLA